MSGADPQPFRASSRVLFRQNAGAASAAPLLSASQASQAGLSVQLSGIAWWTTDIGGYSGGNPADPTFRELIVRWFQYGATCPLFRQHGARNTEPWGYGNESYAAIVKVINWRKSMEPYVLQQMATVNATGMPINRPLWVCCVCVFVSLMCSTVCVRHA